MCGHCLIEVRLTRGWMKKETMGLQQSLIDGGG